MSRPKTGLKNLYQSYRKNCQGGFAIMFAVTSLVILGGVAVAVDGSRIVKARANLQNTVDGLALIAARDGIENQAELNALAEEYFTLSYSDLDRPNVRINSITRNGDTVTVDAVHDVDTQFAAIIGFDEIDVAARSEATFAQRKLDIALVLDNTGSMRGRRLAALKEASNDLVDILYENPTLSSGTQLGLVPFATWVNVGTDQVETSALDTAGQSPQNQIYFDEKVSRFTLYNKLGARWNGCLENRLPPYDVDDTAPNLARPETLYQPAFQPDMADNGSNNFTYVADANGGNQLQRLRETDKYNTGAQNRGPEQRFERSCDTRRKVTPLTNNVSRIRRGINNMFADGFTNIANGAAWGFRLISPNAPFTQGRPYEDPDLLKAMVILTDGAQTMSGQFRGQFGSNYGPFGFLGEPSLPGQRRLNGNNPKDALDSKLLEVCSAAKARGIVVYTITFELNDPATQDIMRDCATDPSQYFPVATAAELSPAFRQIAASLGDLRITQ